MEPKKTIFDVMEAETRGNEEPKDEGKASDGKGEGTEPNIKDILANQQKQQKTIEQLLKENEELRKASATTERIRTAIVGDDKPKDNGAAERDRYTADAFSYTKEELAKIKEDARNEALSVVAPMQVEAILGRAQRALSKEYDLVIGDEQVDWDDPRVDKKVGAHLQLLDPTFKKKNPDKALRYAAKAAGLLRKRTDDLPSYESGSSPARRLSPTTQKKLDKAEIAAIASAGNSDPVFEGL